jgi:hypothetical protein
VCLHWQRLAGLSLPHHLRCKFFILFYDGIFCYFLWHEQQEQFLFVADLNWSASLERDRRNESCTGLQQIKIDWL